MTAAILNSTYPGIGMMGARSGYVDYIRLDHTACQHPSDTTIALITGENKDIGFEVVRKLPRE